MSKGRDSGLLPGTYSYSQLETPQELGQVTIASLSQEQERHSFSSGAGGLLGNVKQENQPLRPFFDEWPGTRDSWSEMDDARSNRTSFSTTQLSISIPMPRCEFPFGLAYLSFLFAVCCSESHQMWTEHGDLNVLFLFLAGD
jgi:hypothetical protein